MATLYRKYRPQRFRDVASQEHITRTLQAALAFDRVGHAYLFAGPRGTGKTTLARLLAKAINCVQRAAPRSQAADITDPSQPAASLAEKPLQLPTSSPEPCNGCQHCREITDGRSLDVIEIDAASNRGIDEMRELRDKIKFAPTLARAKVFIIDEVHMLTKEAFNALLKTLEEPPKHAIFVLATTELHKVPVTIASRCQVFLFKKARGPDLTARLGQVATAEQIAAEPEALAYIATLAGGSYRDALSLFDQVASLPSVAGPGGEGGQERLTIDAVQRILGLASFERLVSLLEAIAAGDADQALQRLDAAESDGLDLEQLTVQLIDVGRELLHARIGHARPVVSREIDAVRWEALVGRWSVPELLGLIRALVDARQLMKLAPTPALPLELAVVKLVGEQKPEARSFKVTDAGGNEPLPQPTSQPPAPPPASSETVGAPPVSSAVAETAWQSLLARLRSQHPNLHGLLQQAHCAGIEGEHLVVHVPFQFAADRLSDKKHRAVIEGILPEMFGSQLALRCLVRPAAIAPKLDDGVPNPQLIDVAMELFGDDQQKPN